MSSLVTERVVLREFTEDDWAPLFAIESHPDVNRYQAYDAYDEAKARWYVGRVIEDAAATPRLVWDFAITRRGDDRMIGRGGFKRSASDSRLAEMWAVLDPREQGAGLVTEAARVVIAYAFGLGVHRLHGECDPRNTGSSRLMERLGMRKEAHYVQNVFIKGEWCDSVIYAMLASEWR